MMVETKSMLYFAWVVWGLAFVAACVGLVEFLMGRLDPFLLFSIPILLIMGSMLYSMRDG